MMSSTLSGINVIASMILIWIQESKIKLPDSIHKFIYLRLSKLLRVETIEMNKAFLPRSEMLDIWNPNPPTENAISKSRTIGLQMENSKENDFKDLEKDNVQQQYKYVTTLLETLNNKLEEIKSSQNKYLRNLCNDDTKEKIEQHLLATMLNRLFGIMVLILNVGLLLYTIICYSFSSK